MGRTKLKGMFSLVTQSETGECDVNAECDPDFSPTPAHSPDVYSGNRFFGWIIPTLKTSEFTVLQTVGLDAAVVSYLDDLGSRIIAEHD